MEPTIKLSFIYFSVDTKIHNHNTDGRPR